MTDEPEFDIPREDEWRVAPGKGQSKQGSGGVADLDIGIAATSRAEWQAQESLEFYENLLDRGIAPEQARLVLPMSLLTEWIWTGSLYAFIRICKERLAPDAQAETRAVAEGIYGSLREHFPASMAAWGIPLESGEVTK